MNAPFIVHYGDPVWKGGPSKERIREICDRYIFDSFNRHGFGRGAIIDSYTAKPIPQPELPEIK